MKKVRVLVVDDSALIRNILSEGLAKDPHIEVVATASNPYIARDKIVEFDPDVLTLDVEMPRMDGVEFLRRLMPQYPKPVIIVSALTKQNARITMEALEAGAVDIVTKPSIDVARGLGEMLSELCEKVKMAAGVNVQHWKKKKTEITPKLQKIRTAALAESTDKVVAIGASTGGTEALRRIIRVLPADMPGIVIVQHMPPGFTKHFADSLNDITDLEVVEAKTGDRVVPGRILIAPGGKHMQVARYGGMYKVSCEPGVNVSGHCPSVDVLFESVAKYVGANALGVILTGMGSDGAAGMLMMHKAGAYCVAQDEKSSVVFGMPKVAFEKGGAEVLLPLDRIPDAIVRKLSAN